MQSFKEYIRENTTANMVYMSTSGANFSMDVVPTDFDIENWAEKKNDMLPWEVRNAKDATTRRTHLLKWLKAAGANSKEAVNDKSIPITPGWQSANR